MSRSFAITHVEATATFTLYHLDTPMHGANAIVCFRAAPAGLEPTLAMLARKRLRFDFEVEPGPSPSDDPRLGDACQIRAVTL